MVNRDIVERISGGMKRGLDYDEVYHDLLMRGYSDFEINEAKNFILSGGEVQKEDYSLRKYEPTKLFWIFGIMIFVISMFIVFGAIFADIGEKQISISFDSLGLGVDLDLKKTNSIVIQNFSGEDLKFEIEVDTGIFVFSGDIGEFSLFPLESNEVDVNNDGYYDLKFSYPEKGTKKLHIEELCRELWDCSEWTPCVGGTQKRICTDKSNCGTEYNRPYIEVKCNFETPEFNFTLPENESY